MGLRSDGGFDAGAENMKVKGLGRGRRGGSERNYKSVRFPAGFPVAVLSIRAKNDLKGKGFISVCRLQSIMEENQGSLKGGSEAKTMEEQCLLAYLLCWSSANFPNSPETFLPPEVTPTTVVLALVSPLTIKKMPPPPAAMPTVPQLRLPQIDSGFS